MRIRDVVGRIASVWNNMSRSLVATIFIIFFALFATITQSKADEFSINCGLNLNFTEKDACFVQFEEFLYIKFSDHKAVNIATLSNGSLTIRASSTFLHNSPKISYSPQDNRCIASFHQLAKNTVISCGLMKCTLIDGCIKHINKVTHLSIRSQTHADITTGMHYSLFEILPFLKVFKKQSLNSHTIALIASIATLILITAILIVAIHLKLNRSAEKETVGKTNTDEKESFMYSDCICLENPLPKLPISENYFSLEHLQRTVSLPW